MTVAFLRQLMLIIVSDHKAGLSDEAVRISIAVGVYVGVSILQ